MSATSGPDIVSDSLVFYYDTGNSRDSYKGEPTENLVTNPTFLGTSGTQTSAIADNWYFSGYSGDTGFKFYNSTTSPIPLKFPNEGAVITTGPNGSTNRRIYYNSTVEPNTTYTLSYWLYSSAYGSISNYFFTYQADGTDAGSTSYGQGFTTGQWVFIKQSFTTPSITSNTRNVSWGPVISYSTDSLFAIQRFQVEAKSHATQFVNGTRSATQGLLDISGQGTSIDISNASFDSNAQMTFDGTDDYVDVGLYHLSGSSHSEEVVIYRNATGGSGHGILSDLQYGFYGLYINSSNQLQYRQMQQNPGQTPQYPSVTITAASPLSTGYYHIVGVYNNDNGFQLYVNGNLEASSETILPFNLAGGRGINHIGVYKTSAASSYTLPFNGRIETVKAYSRALTAAEVKQNYDSIKTRFGLT